MAEMPRPLVQASRTLHVYLSMLALLALLLFSITGFMLNHAEWFDAGEPRVATQTVSVPPEVLAGDRLAMVEFLRRTAGATGVVTDYHADEQAVRVQFKSPGRQTEAVVSRTEGNAQVTHESRGVAALLGDLHRGKNTGGGWRIVIDVTAILLFVTSVTGLALWMTLPRRTKLGLAALGVATVLMGLAVAAAMR